jgi:hypothetical protein
MLQWYDNKLLTALLNNQLKKNTKKNHELKVMLFHRLWENQRRFQLSSPPRNSVLDLLTVERLTTIFQMSRYSGHCITFESLQVCRLPWPKFYCRFLRISQDNFCVITLKQATTSPSKLARFSVMFSHVAGDRFLKYTNNAYGLHHAGWSFLRLLKNSSLDFLETF